MKTMNKLATILAMGAMFESDIPMFGSNRSKININNVTGNLPEPPLPNGCKWYYFNDGYKCIASSQKSANRKHIKQLNK